MMGTLANGIAILIGGSIGLLIHKGLPKKIEDAVMEMLGLTVLIIGLNGVLTSCLSVVDGKIKDDGALILLISLVVGTIIGTVIDIDGALNRFGEKIQQKLGKDGFAKGFVAASLIFCIGAMSIVGAINDGLRNDPSVLLVKGTIDGITSIVLASSLGYGVLFASVSVVLYQGAISLMASSISGILQGRILDMVCLVGYAMVMTLGTNFLGATKIKTANLLPALLFVPFLVFIGL